MDGPVRTNNHEFLKEFHQLYHQGQTEKYEARRKPPQVNAGNGLDNFNMAMLEDRIREYVMDVVQAKTSSGGFSADQIQMLVKREVAEKLRGVNRIKEELRTMKREQSELVDMSGGTSSEMVQAHMMEEMQEQIISEGLKTAPIRGADVPIREIEKNGRGQLIMVEELGEKATNH